MKANKGKSHLLVSGRCHKTMNVCGAEFKNSDQEELLGVKIDSMINLEEHFSNFLTKAICKINALSRVMLT